MLQASRCNAGVGRASSFGPFLDRIGSSGTSLRSNLLRSRQPLAQLPCRTRLQTGSTGPPPMGRKSRKTHPREGGARGHGARRQGGQPETRGAYAVLAVLMTAGPAGVLGMVPSAGARAALLFG